MVNPTAVAPGSSTSSTPVPHGSVVATYETHQAAADAIRMLANAGFDMKKLSIVGKDYSTEEGAVGYYNSGDRIKAWGKTGAFWGGLWGMLFGSALFVIPGVGPLFAAGPLVAWIVGGLEGATVVGGMSALGAGLFSIGIPKDSVVQYELALKTDQYLLLVSDSPSEVARARDIIGTTWALHSSVHAPELVGADVK